MNQPNNNHGDEGERERYASTLPPLHEIRMYGKIVGRYPVDESFTVANAGDAEVYLYMNKKYEVITWDRRAEEHEDGEITISRIENE